MIAVLFAGLALAQAQAPPIGPRILIPPGAVDAAPITTHLRLRQGAGLLRVPKYKMPGWPGRVDLALAGVLEAVEFQGALSHRTALYGRIGGQAITGINVDSAFLHGAQSSGFIELGARNAVWIDPSGIVTVRGLVSGTRGAGLSPEPLASAFAADRWRTVSALLDGQALEYVLGTRSGMTAGVGVSGLRALTDTVGLQGSVTTRVGRVTYAGADASASTSRTFASAGVAVDWRPGSVPVGCQIEIHDRQEQEGWLAGDLNASGSNRALLAGTVAYTGRQELHLGLTGAILTPIGLPKKEQLYTAELTLRYDFGRAPPPGAP